jgi:hypothetical protein
MGSKLRKIVLKTKSITDMTKSSFNLRRGDVRMGKGQLAVENSAPTSFLKHIKTSTKRVNSLKAASPVDGHLDLSHVDDFSFHVPSHHSKVSLIVGNFTRTLDGQPIHAGVFVCKNTPPTA